MPSYELSPPPCSNLILVVNLRSGLSHYDCERPDMHRCYNLTDFCPLRGVVWEPEFREDGTVKKL